MAITTPISSTPTFEAQAREVLLRVRAAVADVVGTLVGHQDVRATELVDSLGVDPRLAWKFVKVLELRDPLRAVKYVPGQRGVKLFMRAARRKAPASTLEQMRRAFADLDALVRQEAGDRRSFSMMISGHARDAEGDAGLEHRKAAFEPNGFIWGVQARVQIHSYLLQPAGDGVNLDAATVRGFVDLRRIRPQTPWRISRFYGIDDAGEIRSEFVREPIDARGGETEAPLLRDFCSEPLPTVKRVLGPGGIIDYVLPGSDVGNAQSVTCLTGEMIRRAEPCFPDERHACLGTKAQLRTPCELVVMDLFLHSGFFGDVMPTVRLVSDLFNDSLGAHYTDADVLPTPARVQQLGQGADIPPVLEMPRYREMIGHCFERLGWNAADFRCFRVRLSYPPIPAAVLVDCPLPERPAARIATSGG